MKYFLLIKWIFWVNYCVVWSLVLFSFWNNHNFFSLRNLSMKKMFQRRKKSDRTIATLIEQKVPSEVFLSFFTQHNEWLNNEKQCLLWNEYEYFIRVQLIVIFLFVWRLRINIWQKSFVNWWVKIAHFHISFLIVVSFIVKIDFSVNKRVLSEVILLWFFCENQITDNKTDWGIKDTSLFVCFIDWSLKYFSIVFLYKCIVERRISW